MSNLLDPSGSTVTDNGSEMIIAKKKSLVEERLEKEAKRKERLTQTRNSLAASGESKVASQFLDKLDPTGSSAIPGRRAISPRMSVDVVQSEKRISVTIGQDGVARDSVTGVVVDNETLARMSSKDIPNFADG